jgi:hypothetical protein
MAELIGNHPGGSAGKNHLAEAFPSEKNIA